MTPLALVTTAPKTCPTCGSELSLPLRGRGKRAGQVVQTCRAFQTCGLSTWTDAADAVTPAAKDDSSRHGRYLLPVTFEPEPPVVVAPDRWMSVGRRARRELDAINRQDRKLAAAGGDR
jgi:hypothetical protein